MIIVDVNGWTPLHKGILSNNTEVLEILNKNGSNVNAGDKNGNTVVHLAVEEGNLSKKKIKEVGGDMGGAKKE